MSFIYEPDMHPGRCKNVRTVFHPDGHVETLRCVDYEKKRHVCEFPEPTHHPIQWTNVIKVYTAPKPKPWVKPGDGDA